MDYYQGVVNEYLRANRATFINTEYCIQLARDVASPEKGTFWYCDAVALSFVERKVYLCEVTFAVKPIALMKRLQAWSTHWNEVEAAVRRDSHFMGMLDGWTLQPWVFLPHRGIEGFNTWTEAASLNFEAKVTDLEKTQAWKYRSWDRSVEAPGDCGSDHFL